MSDNYHIKIIYSLLTSPKVFLVSPQLVKRHDADKIPHTYYDGYLCLYFPKAKQFTRDMLISKTIVPWTSLWLYYYEVWHATGHWIGGGSHPESWSGKTGQRHK